MSPYLPHERRVAFSDQPGSSRPGCRAGAGLGILLALLSACGNGEDPTGDTDETVIVDLVTGLSAPVDRIVTVGLRGGADVTLELGTPIAGAWHDMLAHSQEYERPVYIEIAPATRHILDVGLPYMSPVLAVSETAAGAEVQLLYSAAIHFLYRERPRYRKTLQQLQAAVSSGTRMVVTVRVELGIVDVRPDTFTRTP